MNKCLKKKNIPHLLFTGVQGAGKTTLSKIIVNELGIDPLDVLIINASDENDVDTMRTKIKSFVSTYAINTELGKIVQLEEADYLSQNAQAILRQIMEEYCEVTKFILTCNYEHKIIPALRSRCQVFKFKAFDKNDIAEYVATILLAESVKFDLTHIDAYIAVGYPDIRKIINLLQQNTIDSILEEPKSIEDGDYKFTLLDLLEIDKWEEIRRLLCNNVGIEEWPDIYKFLYQNISEHGKFKKKKIWEEAIIIISEYLYRNEQVADREINFAACAIKLSQL